MHRSKRKAAGFVLLFMLLVALLDLLAFSLSLAEDWRMADLELFELVARIIGYALVLASDALCVAAARHYAIKGSLGKPARVATVCAFASVLFLCAHDLLLYETYGNQLEGTFTMAAFFALDAGLLLLYPVILYLSRKRRTHPALRPVLLLAALLWAAYIIADMAGYPAARIVDWDEALIKFTPLCQALMLFIFVKDDAAVD